MGNKEIMEKNEIKENEEIFSGYFKVSET